MKGCHSFSCHSCACDACGWYCLIDSKEKVMVKIGTQALAILDVMYSLVSLDFSA